MFFTWCIQNRYAEFSYFSGFKSFETNVRPIPCNLNEGLRKILHAIYRPQNWTNNFFHVDTPNLRQNFDDDAFRLPFILVNIYFSPNKLYGSYKARFLANNQL